MTKNIRLAVVGVGLVGQRHVAAIKSVDGADLSAIADPIAQGKFGVTCYATLEDLLRDDKPDGVVLATPTPQHLEGALACIAAKCPVLIEKPITVTAAEAREVTAAAARADVPVLVGHHRRHNPLIQKAAGFIEKGQLGELRSVQATCWFYKPDDYFEASPWRTKPGAGPILVNLVHDVDLLRYFCGEVIKVQAQAIPARRGFENEDLASAILVFESGVVATISVSDSIVSPWSWELTSGENPIYPKTDQSCYLIGGSAAALSLPDMRLWQHDGKQSWWAPMSATPQEVETADPLQRQIAHFADVIRGEASPLVSGVDGLRTLEVIEAIHIAASSGETVHLPQVGAYAASSGAASQAV